MPMARLIDLRRAFNSTGSVSFSISKVKQIDFKLQKNYC